MTNYNPNSIKSIKIIGLYEYFSYNIKKEIEDLSDVLILYGDNGSGKTTILKLIFHLLSPHPISGHKTQLSYIPFKELSVEFYNGTIIAAKRKDIIHSRNYFLFLYEHDNLITSLELKFDKETIKPYHETSEWSIIAKKLKQINLKIFFLTDERKLLSDEFVDIDELSEFNEILHKDELRKFYPSKRLYSLKKKKDAIKSTNLSRSISRMQRWINKKYNIGTIRSEDSISDYYMKLLESFNIDIQNKYKQVNLENMILKLNDFKNKFSNYSNLGLSAPIEVEKFISNLKSSKKQNLNEKIRIIDTYLKLSEKKYDGLTEIYGILNIFVRSLNNYYKYKTLSYKISKGLEITSKNGVPIKPGDLSSGEKQLLILFCNVVSSNDVNCIFLIDEPEISLNVKWQRNLINTLLRLRHKGNIQYIFATHSIELLTQYKNKVLKLYDEGFSYE